jgi:fucose permease
MRESLWRLFSREIERVRIYVIMRKHGNSKVNRARKNETQDFRDNNSSHFSNRDFELTSLFIAMYLGIVVSALFFVVYVSKLINI